MNNNTTSTAVTVGSKNKAGSKIIAPIPLKSHHAAYVDHFPASGNLDNLELIEDDWSNDINGLDTEAENEIQQIFGGGMNYSIIDEDYIQPSLYDSDDKLPTLLDRPNFSIAFPILGVSPAPMDRMKFVPSRAKNPIVLNSGFFDLANSDKKKSPVQLLLSFIPSPKPRHRSYSEPMPINEAVWTEVGSNG